MKRHKVDPNNLPTEEVIAINKWGAMRIGQLNTYSQSGIITDVFCESSVDNLWDVTHYILKSDLLNLPEVSETMESEDMLWGEAARAIVAHYENSDMDENDTTLSELKQHFIIQRR